MATTETRKMVLAAVAVCDEKKAEDTRVLELDPADSAFTDFFLITSGTNTRQTVAIADDIELKMKREFGTYANSVEGRRTGEWILMDYVDFVVHIFVEEKRAFYDIERLRKSARSVDAGQLKAALTEKTAAARKVHPRPSVAEASATEPAAPAKKSAARKTAGNKTLPPKKTATRKSPRSTTRAAAGKTSATKKAPAKKSAIRIAAASESKAKAGTARNAAAEEPSARPAKRKPAK